MKNYESEIPAGYRETKVVDATNTKVTTFLTLGSLLLTAGIIALSFLFCNPFKSDDYFSFTHYVIAVIGLLVYLILHELTHGIAYYALTRHKLKFGLTLTVAYCGVPDIYVYRKTAMIALLSPFIVFSVVFTIAIILAANQWDKFFAICVFAIHFGGCIGDLYDTYLYLTMFKDPTTLMQDTGPKQTFYTK